MRVVLANHSSAPGAADDLARVLREQAALGLDLVTDGQLGWDDAIAPLLAGLGGVRLGPTVTLPGLARPYRQPIVEAKLRRHRSLCVDAYRRAAALTEAPIKVVCTGPHTLAHAAGLATTAYRSADHLAEELGAILAQEIAALVAAGAPAIQIEEPLILARPQDIRRLRALLEPLYDAAAGSALIIVATYGADAAALYAQLNSLPADVIAVDCAGRAGVCDAIAATGSGKPLALGVLDGASPGLEEPRALAQLLERLLRRYTHPTVYLQPSCGLRSLSPEQARAKLALLPALREVID